MYGFADDCESAFLSKGIYNIWYVSEELYTEYSSVMYMLFDGVVIYNDSCGDKYVEVVVRCQRVVASDEGKRN